MKSFPLATFASILCLCVWTAAQTATLERAEIRLDAQTHSVIFDPVDEVVVQGDLTVTGGVTTVRDGVVVSEAQALERAVAQAIDRFSPCTSSPCADGSTCVTNLLAHTYTCHCAPNRSGALCDGYFCPPVGCGENGHCDSTLSCVCAAGYTGAACTVSLSACASSPCLNGGSCTTSVDDAFLCACVAPYTGPQCQFNSTT